MKLNKKWILSTLSVCAFGAVLTGCDGDDDGGPSPQPTGTATTVGTPSATGTATATGTPNGPNVQVIALVRTGTNQTGNSLVTFNAARAGTAIRTANVTGLNDRSALVGIDFRPSNRFLYGVGSDGQLYVLNPGTGAATRIGSGSGLSLTGGVQFGFDFNPVPDRIRVVGDNRLNFRINPNTGAAVDGVPATGGVQPDGQLAYAPGDTNAGRFPRLVGAAYSNNVSGATSTTNYAIDAATGALVTQGSRAGTTPSVSPNTGQLFTVGSIGTGVGTGPIGFDIGRDDVALASINNTLFQIDLSNGNATRLSDIAKGTGSNADSNVLGIAIVPTS